MTHCNCKQMGSDTQLLIEQSNSTLLDRYKRSVKFKSCPNIVTPVIFVYSSIYLKCLIIRKMPATFFKTPLPPYWQFGIAPANRRPPSNSSPIIQRIRYNVVDNLKTRRINILNVVLLISIIYFFTRTPHISQAFNGCCSCC